MTRPGSCMSVRFYVTTLCEPCKRCVCGVTGVLRRDSTLHMNNYEWTDNSPQLSARFPPP